MSKLLPGVWWRGFICGCYFTRSFDIAWCPWDNGSRGVKIENINLLKPCYLIWCRWTIKNGINWIINVAVISPQVCMHSGHHTGFRAFIEPNHSWYGASLQQMLQVPTVTIYVIRFYPPRVSGISIAPAVGQRCHHASCYIGGNNRSSVVLNRVILVIIKHRYMVSGVGFFSWSRVNHSCKEISTQTLKKFFFWGGMLVFLCRMPSWI